MGFVFNVSADWRVCFNLTLQGPVVAHLAAIVNVGWPRTDRFLCCLLLLQTEKPDRQRHTFASLALRKRYSYLAEPALSEFDIFTNKPCNEFNYAKFRG